MNERVFKPEYNKYDKIISSKYTTLVVSLIFAIVGLLNIFINSGVQNTIAGISFLIMAILSFLSFIQGRPFFSIRKDYQNLKISNEKIIINEHSWTSGKKIYFNKLKKYSCYQKIF